jgi:hypothetical protein
MNMHAVSPLKMVVRCFAECIDGQWQAFSLEFGLAAQADSYIEAKTKLDGMIQDYLYDALVGEDRDNARELLSRKATFRAFVRYYSGSLSAGLSKAINRSVKSKQVKIFDEPWSFTPERCAV